MPTKRTTTARRKTTPKKEDKLPLALRYRPTSFADIIGQDTTVSVLRGLFRSGRIPRTISFSGPYSSGKTTLARLFALYANCAGLVKGEPCGKCPSCVAMREVILGHGSHPDLHELDAASQRGIDDVRALKRLAELHPVNNWRIFILDECHMYTKEAWQSALKMFERPPGKTIFILCTTEDVKIPVTIRSRATQCNLQAVKVADTTRLLRKICKEEGYAKTVGKKLRVQISRQAEGHPRNALHILETVFNYVDANRDITTADILKMFPKLVEDTPAMKGYIAAQDFVNAVLRGQYVPAFSAVLLADDPVVFINHAVGMMRLHVEATIDRKLINRDRAWLLGKLSGPKQSEARGYLAEYGEMLGVLLEAQQRIKSFIVDAPATLEVAALECIAITHGILASKGGGKSSKTSRK